MRSQTVIILQTAAPIGLTAFLSDYTAESPSATVIVKDVRTFLGDFGRQVPTAPVL